MTQTFNIPFRPSQSAVCGDRRWSQDGSAATCFNGFANNVTFNLASRGVDLPDRLIVALAFNTQSWGEQPTGTDGPYNSLNWALPPAGPTVGTLPRPNDAYWNTATAANYCDGGVAGVGVFRLDAEQGACNWTGFQPGIRIDATTTGGTPGATGPAGPTGPAGTTGLTGSSGGTLGQVKGSGTIKKCKRNRKAARAAKKCKKKIEPSRL